MYVSGSNAIALTWKILLIQRSLINVINVINAKSVTSALGFVNS